MAFQQTGYATINGTVFLPGCFLFLSEIPVFFSPSAPLTHPKKRSKEKLTDVSCIAHQCLL